MNDHILERFLDQELNDAIRILFKVAIDDSVDSKKKLAVCEFEFNCFDVVLDFENNVAILVDVLSDDEGSEQKIPLQPFFKACDLS